jgi:hypothetical protein
LSYLPIRPYTVRNTGGCEGRIKESRRLWFRDLLMQLGVAYADALATQLALLVDGSIAQDLVRNDPAMARAAKEAATVLLRNAGVNMGGSAKPSRAKKARPSSTV